MLNYKECCNEKANIADLAYDSEFGCFYKERMDYDVADNVNTGKSCGCKNQCGCKKPSCKPAKCQGKGCFSTRTMRLCADGNGTACYYPACDRDKFWPDFSAPECITCCQLYSGVNTGCSR